MTEREATEPGGASERSGFGVACCRVGSRPANVDTARCVGSSVNVSASEVE